MPPNPAITRSMRMEVMAFTVQAISRPFCTRYAAVARLAAGHMHRKGIATERRDDSPVRASRRVS